MGSRSRRAKNRNRLKQPQDNKSRGPALSPIDCLPLVLSQEAQDAIRKKAAKSCSRAWDSLAQAQRTLEDFRQIDEPVYRKWQQECLKGSIAEREQILSDLRSLATLIEAIEREEFLSEISSFEAFNRVTAPGYDSQKSANSQDDAEQNFSFKGRSQEGRGDCNCEACRAERELFGASGDSFDGAEEDDPLEGLSETGIFDEFFEAMVEDLFDDAYGDQPMSSRQRRRAFESFREQVKRETDYEGFRQKVQHDSKIPQASESKSADEVRCLTLYRWLAKRLHPDRTQEKSSLSLELWHMAQDAYRARNLAELSKIQALCCLLKGASLEGLSIADAYAAARELKRKTKSSRKELSRIKESGLLGFATTSEKDRQKRLAIEKRSIERELSELRQSLARLQSHLSELKTPPTPRGKKKPKKTKERASQAQDEGGGQMGFEF